MKDIRLRLARGKMGLPLVIARTVRGHFLSGFLQRAGREGVMIRSLTYGNKVNSHSL